MPGYEKFMGKTYLVFLYDDCKENYEMSMLEKNNIEGLVKFEKWCINGKYEYRYDITNKKSLSVFAESRKLVFEDVKRIFEALFTTIDLLKEFLMEPDSIILEPEFIYISDSKAEFVFNYEERKNFTDSFSVIIKYMLDKLDYSDNKTVELAYKMFDAACGNADTGRLEEIFKDCIRNASGNHVNENKMLKKDDCIDEAGVSGACLNEFLSENNNICKNSIQSEMPCSNEPVAGEYASEQLSGGDGTGMKKMKSIAGQTVAVIFAIVIICMMFKIFN